MLENYWYIVSLSKQLKQLPVAIQIFNKKLVLFRDANGKPAALEDRCQHRNAPLSCGKIVDGTVQCPYHGWRYDKSGRLVEIPYSNSLPSTAIPAYSCLEQDGYIWLCPGTPEINRKPYNFPHLDQPGWTSFKMDTLFTGTVEACLENFLDCPHATHVHRSWFRTPTSKPVKAIIQTLEDGAVAEYFNEPREKSVVWSLLSPSGEEMKHTDRFIAPATSRVDYHFSKGRRYIISSCCTPVDKNTTRVHTVISFRYGIIGPLVGLFFKPLSKKIITQDVDIMKLQHNNVKRFGRPDFTVISEDLLYSRIAAWRKSIKEGSPSPKSGDESHVDMRL